MPFNEVYVAPYIMATPISCLAMAAVCVRLKENAEALVAATRDTGLEVSTDKTKYMVMSRDQNAGRIHSVRIVNIAF
jgi:hypothetical protein